MNLPFQLRKDKGLREDPFSQPYQLVSLWDMLDFYAAVFIKICNHLTKIDALMGCRLKHHINSVDFTSLLESLPEYNTIPDCCAATGLMNAKRHADEFITYINSDEELECQEVKSLAHALKWQIIYELEDRKLLIIPSLRAEYYNIPETFLGNEIIHKLSDVTKSDLIKDASEAGNCFALGRHTACVFHLMRIMERLVQIFASNVGAEVTHKGKPVEIKYAEWHEIEDAIQTKIKGMSQGERKSRFNAALTTLGAVRLGVRNEVMHPRGIYDEEDAKKLLGDVKSFVHDVVTLPPL